MYYEGREIGQEEPTIDEQSTIVKMNDRFEQLKLDQECCSIIKQYKSVFTGIDKIPLQCDPMRIHNLHKRPIYAKQRQYEEVE